MRIGKLPRTARVKDLESAIIIRNEWLIERNILNAELAAMFTFLIKTFMLFIGYLTRAQKIPKIDKMSFCVPPSKHCFYTRGPHCRWVSLSR
jgi:hypothetical protein